MIGWGLVGVTAAPLRHVLRNRYALAAFGIAWGFLFDWLMDVWAWSSLGSGANAGSFLAFVSTGLPFDIAHATGNAVLALVAGPMPDPDALPVCPAPASNVQTIGAAMIRRALILSLPLAALLASAAHATGGAAYLATRLTLSGGSPSPAHPPSVSLTEWAVMGLAAAGRNPADAPRRRPPAGRVPGRPRQGLEQRLLAGTRHSGGGGAGQEPEQLRRPKPGIGAAQQDRRTGRIGRLLNSTYWGVLALRAAGSPVPARSIEYIRSRAQPADSVTRAVPARIPTTRPQP